MLLELDLMLVFSSLINLVSCTTNLHWPDLTSTYQYRELYTVISLLEVVHGDQWPNFKLLLQFIAATSHFMTVTDVNFKYVCRNSTSSSIISKKKGNNVVKIDLAIIKYELMLLLHHFSFKSYFKNNVPNRYLYVMVPIFLVTNLCPRK